ncbi:hypothetical protein C8Q76DRAFT_803385 [Earliella scabrosa]|nr:hypothetical protein C8Q76DRAFT_803385 [Earliella scabrosa]
MDTNSPDPSSATDAADGAMKTDAKASLASDSPGNKANASQASSTKACSGSWSSRNMGPTDSPPAARPGKTTSHEPAPAATAPATTAPATTAPATTAPATPAPATTAPEAHKPRHHDQIPGASSSDSAHESTTRGPSPKIPTTRQSSPQVPIPDPPVPRASAAEEGCPSQHSDLTTPDLSPSHFVPVSSTAADTEDSAFQPPPLRSDHDSRSSAPPPMPASQEQAPPDAGFKPETTPAGAQPPLKAPLTEPAVPDQQESAKVGASVDAHGADCDEDVEMGCESPMPDITDPDDESEMEIMDLILDTDDEDGSSTSPNASASAGVKSSSRGDAQADTDPDDAEASLKRRRTSKYTKAEERAYERTYRRRVDQYNRRIYDREEQRQKRTEKLWEDILSEDPHPGVHTRTAEHDGSQPPYGDENPAHPENILPFNGDEGQAEQPPPTATLRSDLT